MDEMRLNLLPQPRRCEIRSGNCRAPVRCDVALDPAVAKSQGYLLLIEPDRCRIIAHDQAGEFYARQTLAQLRLLFPDSLPCLQIEDWPDYPVRGVMLDISRDKVPTMPTLVDLVDLFSQWKINQLQLYTEHTFAYAGHEDVWKNASPMTAQQIVELDTYCRERFIELVPNQNSFGHMERWLRLPRYRALAEAAEGADTPWGYRWKGPFSLCPTDPASIAFLSDLYDQLLPHFTSKFFNVGCDETFDIGQPGGRSRDQVVAKGATQVYLDFLHQVHGLVARHGRTMMFWGDIIIDQPDLIGRLPRPVIALEWGYEADHPFDRDGRLFAQAGVPFYVCPGTSSWLSIAGRTDNMWTNQVGAAENGLKHGAAGYLNTDWGDHGHLQYLPISFAGFAAGAAMSWCVQSNRDLDLPASISLHAFGDKSGAMGKVACDLGNVYQAIGKKIKNSSPLFRILVPSSTHQNPLDGIKIDELLTADAVIQRAIAPLNPVDRLVTDELIAAAAMLRHACQRGMWKLDPTSQSPTALADDMRGIISEHHRLWLARNRPGGLSDSMRRLEMNLAEYQSD